MAVLSKDAINEKLQGLVNWKFEENQIGRNYELKDFKSALNFVNEVGEIAQELDHHPDILIHSWNKVKITVATHSEGGITNKDFELAGKIEAINK